MRVSFHDVHERERTRQHFDHRSKGSGKSRRNYAHMAEDEDPIEDYDMPEYDNIDENAEVFADEALSRMTWSSTEVRWKLIHRTMEPPTMMKSMKLTLQWKSHWAGDAACSKASRGGPHRGGKSKGKGCGKSKSRAYAAGDEPLYFNLGLSDEEDASAFMLRHEDEDEQGKMEQDAGWTELDEKRKTPTYAASIDSDASWSRIAPGYNDSTMPMPAPEVLFPEIEQPGDYMPRLPNPGLQRQMPVLIRDAKAGGILPWRAHSAEGLRKAVRPD
ncbi:SAP domain-containing protein [Durusdinium trenchii]|uniref:SAP domain-containing protein n=1 Tax=Durusdinium trenchii TaxID=1381693 RepID=A0ABP0IAK2_9DINO